MKKLKKLTLLLKARMNSTWGVLRLFPWYVSDVLKQRIKRLPSNNKKILFVLNDDRLFRDDDNSGRGAYQIMKTFSDGGRYNVYFYRPQDFKSYYRLRKYGRLIYGIKNLKFISKLPASKLDLIYAFDTLQPDLIKFRWKNLLYVNIERSPTFQIGNVISIPYPMHPYIYSAKADQDIHQYRKSLRKCRVFFGGNFNKHYYDDPIFKGRYPKYLTRLEALDVLVNSDLNISLISQKNDLDQLFNNHDYLRQMVILQTNSAFPIKAAEWLKVVSHSDFFMCFSGTSYPMCHNVIEAMAVGSIPIIAYSDWFDPELKHGENAIIYTDKEDLIKKVKSVLEMSQEDIQKISKGVLEYYDTYLTEKHLVRKYEEHIQKMNTIMLLPRLVLTEKDNNEGKVFNEALKQMISSS